MSDRETILRRVKKLLALTRSPNQHEAEAAAEAAQRLMQREKIEAGELEESSEVVVDSWPYATRAILWKRDLAFAVARGFFCRSVHVPASERSQNRAWLNFVGKRSDVDSAKEVYHWLVRELKRLAADAPVTSHPVQAQHDFLCGAVWMIDGRLRRGNERFVAEGEKARSLVRASDGVVEAKLKETFKALEASPMGRPIQEYRAWVAGQEAGAQVQLKPKKEVEG